MADSVCSSPECEQISQSGLIWRRERERMIHRGKNIHRTDKEIRVLVNRFTIMLARLTDVLKFVLTSKVHN